MNKLFTAKNFCFYLIFSVFISCPAFELDDFWSAQPKEITKDELRKARFLQGLYPDEMFIYDRKSKILGFPAKEVIFRFSRENKFRSAEIMIDFTNRRHPEANGAQRIQNTENRLSDKISAVLQCRPAISDHSLPNGRIFSIKKWCSDNYRFYVYCSLTRNIKNLSIVFLRIVPVSEPEASFFKLLRTQKTTLYRSQDPDGGNMLKIPFRSQLSNTKGCAFTTTARILNYMGSEINSLTVRILWDKPDNKKAKSKITNAAILGYKHKVLQLNRRNIVEKSCLTFISRYNEQAKTMHRSPIKTQDGGKSWNDSLGKLQPEVLQKVNLDFIDAQKYEDYRNTIVKLINEGHPVYWFVVRCINGAHARAIIGYNLKKDIIYYSDSWSPKQEVKTMPFVSAYLMTRLLEYYTY